MNGQVPERAKEVPSRDEQLKLLFGKLAGNRAFARIRGKMQAFSLTKFVGESDSPTNFCSRWDEFASDVRVVGNTLAQLSRDGWTHAVEELDKALVVPGYMIEGEILPENQIVPATIVVFEFPKVLSMITWIRAGHWMDLNAILDGDIEGRELAMAMFNQFPNLRRYALARRREQAYEGRDILSAYQEDVVRQFKNVKRSFPQGSFGLQVADFTYNDHLEISRHFAGDSAMFAFVLPVEQGEALSLFDRKQQSAIATWQCRVPATVLQGKEFVIGFHCEEFHEDWKTKTAVFASNGCSHGYGTVLIPTSRMRARDYCEIYSSVSGCGATDLDDGEKFAFALEP